jgi:hypothetical protein
MSVQRLSETRPVARKHHRCWHCNRMIAPGQRYLRQFLVCDGTYTLAMHEDCDALWETYWVDIGESYYWSHEDGNPPLIEDWRGSGEFQNLCDDYRGLFPHAVTRLEWWDQKVEIARADRLRAVQKETPCSS